MPINGPRRRKWPSCLSVLANKAETWPEPGCQVENFLKVTKKYFIFATHCAPKKNVTIQRKLFYERKQSPGGTIDEWITQLRLIATYCEYHNQDEMIRDMIVLNSVNKMVQERLLETDDLDLSKALTIAKIHETNIEQMKLISNSDVHYVGSRRERKPATRQRYAAPPVRRTDGARPKTWRSPDDAECSKCGRIHTRQTCPAQDKTFHNVWKPNHFAAMCRSTAPTQSAAVRQRKHPQRVHAIKDADYEMSDQEFTIGCLTSSVNAVHLEDSVRVPETLTTSDLSEEVGVFEILHNAVTDARIENVRSAIQHDQSMQILIRTIQSGWPNKRRRCSKQIQDFWNIRDELAIVDDESTPLVTKGRRIVIPLNSVNTFFSNFTSGTSALRKPYNVFVMLYIGLA